MYFFRTDRVPDFGQDLNKAYLSSFFANFLVHISVKLYSGVAAVAKYKKPLSVAES